MKASCITEALTIYTGESITGMIMIIRAAEDTISPDLIRLTEAGITSVKTGALQDRMSEKTRYRSL